MSCSIHSDYEVIVVCLNIQCKCEEKIACAKCLQDFHFDHPNDCLFIEDILKVKDKLIP